MSQPWLILPTTGSDAADEWHRLGVNAHVAGRLPEAQGHYNHALRLDPRHALACHNLAVLFASSPGLINDALLTIERAALFDSVNYVIPTNHALMALEADRIDEALTQARLAVSLAPKGQTGNHARLALAMVLAVAGHPEEAIPLYEEILETEPNHPAAAPNVCFVQTLTDAIPKDLLKQRKRWYEANGYKGEKKPHDNDRRTDRPLRVGYVGGDFKCHSAAFIFSRVLLHHTAAVEMYLYSTLPVDPKADIRTKAFMEKVGKFEDVIEGNNYSLRTSAGNRWRDIAALSDEDADKLIRQDKIDILVDLAGHTNGGRLALFTRKPAPVQVTAWGFAHGTGLPEMDNFFADQVAVPGTERADYAEQVYDLPSIVTMEVPAEYNIKGTSQSPFRKNGFPTYGVFARYEKMSAKCIESLAEIMRRVPDAKMIFKDHAYKRPYSLKRIMGIMKGVEPERLLFSAATSHPDHLLAYQQCDIILDPYPHGGGVVSLETLYMGVPLITKYGTQPSGRTAASVLTAMGRTDWIAKSDEEYIEKAVDWIGRAKELTAARNTLRDELLQSPVVKDYPAAVERCYQEVWRAWTIKQ